MGTEQLRLMYNHLITTDKDKVLDTEVWQNSEWKTIRQWFKERNRLFLPEGAVFPDLGKDPVTSDPSYVISPLPAPESRPAPLEALVEDQAPLEALVDVALVEDQATRSTWSILEALEEAPSEPATDAPPAS